MGKIPDKPEDIFEGLTSDFKGIFGEELLSIILYGSAARGEYLKKKSDINLLVVLTTKGLERLSDVLKVVQKWKKSAVSVPLFLTPEYINSSLDTFPIEFFNIKRSYKVIFGNDFIGGLEFKDKELRLQLEREIKGKLIHLRESFFESADDKRRLRALFSASLGAFLSLFPVILHLKGVEAAGKKDDIINKVAEVLGLNRELLIKLQSIRVGTYKFSKNEGREIWNEYVEQIRKVAFEVDKLSI